MSATSREVTSTHLTIAQAQHAAALDDLLRQLVYGEGSDWDSIPKAMHDISYRDRYADTLKECGRKSKKGARVENVAKFFGQNDVNAAQKTTAGMPHPLFHELISVWRTRTTASTDAWNLVKTQDVTPNEASGSTSSPPTRLATRVITQCAVVVKEKKNRSGMVGLNYVVCVLDPKHDLSSYHRAGFDPAVMVQVEKFGPWMIALGPGSAMRPACSACWNSRVEFLRAPVYSAQPMLRSTVEEEEELFVLSRVDQQPCAHPEHVQNLRKYSNRPIPPDTLLSIRPAPTHYPALPNLIQKNPPSRSVSVQQSVPPTGRFATPMPPPPPPAPSLPRITIRMPSALRPKPLRTRKLDPKIHQQAVRARVLIAAKRLTLRLHQEVHDVRLESQLVRLELDKRDAEVKLAQVLASRSDQALVESKESVKSKQALLGKMTEKVEAAREAIKKAEERIGVVETARDEARKKQNAETTRAGALVMRVMSLEEEVNTLKSALSVAEQEAKRSTDESSAHATTMRALQAARVQIQKHVAEQTRLSESVATLTVHRDHLEMELKAMNQHYDVQLERQHQHAVEAGIKYEAQVQAMQKHRELGDPALRRELELAQAKVSELEAQVQDADRQAGQAIRELNQLKAAAAKAQAAAAPQAPNGAVNQAAPRRLQVNTTGPVRHSDERSARASPYARSTIPLPLPTPPATASPSSSQSPSPAYITNGNPQMGPALPGRHIYRHRALI